MSFTQRDFFLLAFLLLSQAQLLAQAVESPVPTTPKPKEAPQLTTIFKDKALENAVRKQVFAKRDNQDPLYASDVVNVAIIEGKAAGIKDLTGLEHCTALAQLTLPKNQITDLSPLKGLVKLQYLDLAENQLRQITPLAQTKALQYLDLSHNQVSDLTPLAQISSLNSIYLAHNPLVDVKPLFQLTKLWTLNLDATQVTSLEGIGQLRWLSSLSAVGAKIHDLKPLSPLTKLQFLILNQNQIQDLTPLYDMAKRDLAGSKTWAPYCEIHLEQNPLSETARKQAEELHQAHIRLFR